MLSPTGNGSCAYESPGCRHGGTTPSAAASDFSRALDELSSLSATDFSWWPADASTQPANVVDSAGRLSAATDDWCQTSSCTWTPKKDRGDETSRRDIDGLSRRHCRDWSVDNWPSSIDDLLPTSETYKWMTVRRSKMKTGALIRRLKLRRDCDSTAARLRMAVARKSNDIFIYFILSFLLHVLLYISLLFSAFSYTNKDYHIFPDQTSQSFKTVALDYGRPPQGKGRWAINLTDLQSPT